MKEYIDADALKEELKKRIIEEHEDGMVIIDEDFFALIDDTDAADVRENVHGEWLPVDDKMDAFDCSECSAMVMKKHNFCPVCGADMRRQLND